MSCQCNRVGGPFIAEDPNCPAHGTEAKRRKDEIEDLGERAKTETDVAVLRKIVADLVVLGTEY